MLNKTFLIWDERNIKLLEDRFYKISHYLCSRTDLKIQKKSKCQVFIPNIHSFSKCYTSYAQKALNPTLILGTLLTLLHYSFEVLIDYCMCSNLSHRICENCNTNR